MPSPFMHAAGIIILSRKILIERLRSKLPVFAVHAVECLRIVEDVFLIRPNFRERQGTYPRNSLSILLRRGVVRLVDLTQDLLAS